MRRFICLFLALLVIGHFLSRFPVGADSVWVREVQLVVVALMVIIPYHSWRKVDYYHCFPITALGLLCLGLLVWSGVIRLPLTVDLRPLAILAVQGIISLLACLASTQLEMERRSVV